MAAKSIFIYIPFSDYSYDQPVEYAYFNNLYDTFYIGGYPWKAFKILIDLLIKLNTTRDLQFNAQKEVERLLNLRSLTVDLNISGALPLELWAQFRKLEVLTIAFYPFPIIRELEPQGDLETPAFVKPRKHSKFGKRAEWIFTSATESFGRIEKDLPQWKAPKIEVMVRLTGADEDDDIEKESDDGDDENHSEEGESEDDEGEGEEEERDSEGRVEVDDDATFYAQLEARMSHKVPRDQIKRLKRKHHPSKTVGCLDWECDRPIGTYFTDSEHESGGPEFSVERESHSSESDSNQWG